MWEKLDIESKNSIEEYTKNRFDICDYSFVNLFLWSKGENTEYKIENDVLMIRGHYDNEEYYFMPVPKYETEENILKMKEEIKNLLKEKKRIIYITEYWADKLKNDFDLKENRDYEDYIYSVEDLAFLKGRIYSKKKNRINNFKKNYEYVYEKVTKENVAEVIEFQKSWYQIHSDEKSEVLENENQGILTILENIDKLNIKAGMIKVANKIVAYSIGEKINDRMVVIHIEKALIDYVGSYQIINSLFLQEEWTDCELVNREDDFGDEGLREAKLSYKPLYLLKKFSIS